MRAYIDSPVQERGMGWSRNCRGMGTASGHVEPKDYFFHGTWNEVHQEDIVEYQDRFFFSVPGGSGEIKINGHLKAAY